MSAAALAPAFFYALVMRGVGPNWAAAALVCALCAAGLLRRPPALWIAAAAGLAATALLPFIGDRLTALACALPLALALRGPRAQTQEEGDPWLYALAAAALIPWLRCVSLLLGNPFIALAAVLSGGAAGAALAGGARRRFLDDPRPGSSAAAAIASGTALMAALNFLRVLGLNAGSALFLHAPLRCARDLAALGLPCALASAGCAFVAVFFEERAPRERTAWEPVPAAAAACAAAWLQPVLGPAREAVLAGLLLILYGAARRGKGFLDGSLGSKLLVAGAAAGIALGFAAGDPIGDTWFNRLNAAYPGGRWLMLEEGGPQALGAYRFSTGLTVLVADGVIDANAGDGAKREAHLPILASFNPREVLLVGARNPATVEAAASSGARIDLVEAGPAEAALLRALAPPGWRLPDGVSLKRRPGAAYDVILVEVPVPAHGPDAARAASREAFAAWHRRLKPQGILAVRLPKPYFGAATARALAALRREFADMGVFVFEGSFLAVACDYPLPDYPSSLVGRMAAAQRADDPLLEDYLTLGAIWQHPVRAEELGAPQSQSLDLAPNALPLRDIMAAGTPPSGI